MGIQIAVKTRRSVVLHCKWRGSLQMGTERLVVRKERHDGRSMMCWYLINPAGRLLLEDRLQWLRNAWMISDHEVTAPHHSE